VQKSTSVVSKIAWSSLANLDSNSADLDRLYANRNDSISASEAFFACVRRTALAAGEWDQDFAQDIVLAVLKGLPRISGRVPFSHWLSSVIKRRGDTRLSRKIRDRETLVDLTDQQVPAHAPSDILMDLSFLKDNLTRRIAELLLQGYSQGEVATDLGITQQAISARLTRLRNK